MEQLYRLEFEKTKGARFLSHLDMARLFIRAFRRAKLPLKFSEGFHAHPKVRFSPPLSVGVECLCDECFFTLLDETRAPEKLLALIRQGMADGFTLKSLTPLMQKSKPTSFARYELTFDGASEEELRAALDSDLNVVKRTKSGEKSLDIRPHLKVEAFCSTDEGVTVTLLSPASDALTINPALIVSALNAKLGALQVKRIVKISAL